MKRNSNANNLLKIFDSNKMSKKFLINILKFCNTKFNFVSPHNLDTLMSILNLSLKFSNKDFRRINQSCHILFGRSSILLNYANAKEERFL
ncbi:hypothetical protein BpHYR1_049304 [Brachionus plicatilis]|uniref:Uncharacterized protein n=1 Tax=Brachionus plicatilis TaxID=10195 RepID=A0A3M7SDL9_BRAPC|nr:hypothetical protein BpHYR1_049304 [Brachionus plicatilis]